MAPSWTQLAIVAILLVLLFGRGRISELMSDLGKGIRSFKKGMSEEVVEDESATPIPNSSAAEKTSKTPSKEDESAKSK